MIAAPAATTADGATIGGCELWVHARLGIGAADIVVLVAAHDVLAVRLEMHDHAVLCAVAHAPTAVAGDDVVEEWWRQLGLHVQRYRRQGDVFIGLLDANARLGSITSPAVGGLAPERQSAGGGVLPRLDVTSRALRPRHIRGRRRWWPPVDLAESARQLSPYRLRGDRGAHAAAGCEVWPAA